MEAKLFKFTGYFIDANGDWRKQDVAHEVANSLDMLTNKVEVLEVDIGEWHDEHPLNKCGCPRSEYEKYFR